MFSQSNPQLYSLGFTETNGGIYKLFDDMADMIGRAILAHRDDPAEWARFQKRLDTYEPDLSGGVNYVASDRHATYANIDSMKREYKELRNHMRWPSLEDGYFEVARVPQESVVTSMGPAQEAA